MKIISKNVEQTYNLASKLAKHIKGGDIILLNGDLGAGKTTFVKGFAKEVVLKSLLLVLHLIYLKHMKLKIIL